MEAWRAILRLEVIQTRDNGDLDYGYGSEMEGIRRIWEVFRVVDELEMRIREKPRVIRFGA